jgi:hypothetical protein
MARARGKVLRLNADGSVPPDNYGVTVDGIGGAVLDEIHAWGLRNPFRGRWDAETGLMLLGEVGGNNNAVSMEDVHAIKAGVNYGWPMCEGPCDNPNFPSCSCDQHDSPIFTYGHGGTGKSITGGPVYRGGAFPAHPFDGAYFYGDYVEQWIRYARLVPDELGQGYRLVNDTAFAEDLGPVITIAEAPDGTLWYTTLDGAVRHFVFSDGNAPPQPAAPYVVGHELQEIASFPAGAPAAVTWKVDVASSDNDTLTYTWALGDGSPLLTTPENEITHVYNASGRYAVHVRVFDGSRAVRSDPAVVEVGTAPAVQIHAPIDGATFIAGHSLQLSGAVVGVAADGNASENDNVVRLTWNVLFKHDGHFHPVLEAGQGDSYLLHVADAGHSYTGDTAYVVTLTGTLASGLQSSARVTVWPEKVNLTLATEPTGLVVQVDGLPHTAPYIEDSLANFTHALHAPALYCRDGRTLAFGGWYAGGSLAVYSTMPTTRVRLPVAAGEMGMHLTAVYSDQGACGVPITEGLVLYLHPDGVETSADPTLASVERWADYAQGNSDFTLQGGAAPIRLGADEGGLAGGNGAVLFKGGALIRQGLDELPHGGNDLTMVALVRYDTTGWGGVSFGDIGCLTVLGLGVTPQGNLYVENYCTNDQVQSGVLGTGTGWLIHTVVIRAGDWYHYGNGTLLEQGTLTWQVSEENGFFILGADHGGGYVDMAMAELMVYNRALDDDERGEVEGYLQTLYLTPSAVTPPATTSVPEEDVTGVNILLAPLEVLSDGSTRLAWSYSRVLQDDEFEQVVLTLNEAVLAVFSSIHFTTYTIDALSPGSSAVLMLTLFIEGQAEPANMTSVVLHGATLSTLTSEEMTMEHTTPEAVATNEETTVEYGATTPSTATTTEAVNLASALPGYDLRFQGQPSKPSLRFHTAFQHPDARIFGVVTASPSQCANLCDRFYTCAGIFVWRGADGAARCVGLADLELAVASVTTLTSASYVKVRCEGLRGGGQCAYLGKK